MTVQVPVAASRRQAIFVDGAWRERPAADRLPVVDPTTEDVIGQIVQATRDDVATAAAAAHRTRDDWRGAGFARRAGYLRAIADGLHRRRDELVDLIISEVGTPRRIAGDMQVDIA